MKLGLCLHVVLRHRLCVLKSLSTQDFCKRGFLDYTMLFQIKFCKTLKATKKNVSISVKIHFLCPSFSKPAYSGLICFLMKNC